MELIAVEDGAVTVRIHWSVAKTIAAALKGKECAEDELDVETLAALFEAGALAGNLQVATAETEKLTLAWLRETGGDRVAMRRAEDDVQVA